MGEDVYDNPVSREAGSDGVAPVYLRHSGRSGLLSTLTLSTSKADWSLVVRGLGG